MYRNDIYEIDNRTRTDRRTLRKTPVKSSQGLAESLDMSLGDLLEGMALHCLEGKTPFGEETLAKVAMLREVYGLDLVAEDSHQLDEQ